MQQSLARQLVIILRSIMLLCCDHQCWLAASLYTCYIHHCGQLKGHLCIAHGYRCEGALAAHTEVLSTRNRDLKLLRQLPVRGLGPAFTPRDLALCVSHVVLGLRISESVAHECVHDSTESCHAYTAYACCL